MAHFSLLPNGQKFPRSEQQKQYYHKQTETSLTTMVRFDQDRIDALETEFIELAFDLFKGGRRSQSYWVCDRRIRAWCGASPLVIAKTWDVLDRCGLHELASKERLLWGLHLLASYSNEETAAAFCRCKDEATFRRWAWYLIDEISFLEAHVIVWANRKKNDIGNTSMAGIDGADFRVLGKKLFSGAPDPRFYSYKFKGPGLRYLVALSIRNSDIVFVSGPYLPGVYNDLSVFRQSGLKEMLEHGEKLEADDGYMGEYPAFVTCPGGFAVRQDQERMRGRLRMRHKHVNKRMKNFRCMSDRFRHGVEKHASCFRAVAVLTQLSMESGEPMIDMREYDDRLSDAQVRVLFGV